MITEGRRGKKEGQSPVWNKLQQQPIVMIYCLFKEICVTAAKVAYIKVSTLIGIKVSSLSSELLLRMSFDSSFLSNRCGQ
jgi:hypothetical protein